MTRRGLRACCPPTPRTHCPACRVTEAIRNDEQQVEQIERTHREALQVRRLRLLQMHCSCCFRWVCWLKHARRQVALLSF